MESITENDEQRVAQLIAHNDETNRILGFQMATHVLGWSFGEIAAHGKFWNAKKIKQQTYKRRPNGSLAGWWEWEFILGGATVWYNATWSSTARNFTITANITRGFQYNSFKSWEIPRGASSERVVSEIKEHANLLVVGHFDATNYKWRESVFAVKKLNGFDYSNGGIPTNDRVALVDLMGNVIGELENCIKILDKWKL